MFARFLMANLLSENAVSTKRDGPDVSVNRMAKMIFGKEFK